MPRLPAVSSGFPALDEATGLRGFPRGRITELVGRPTSGRETVAARAVAGANGYSALFQTFVKLDVFFDPEIMRQESLATANYQGLVKKTLRNMFPDVEGRRDKRMLYKLVSSGASFQLRDMVLKHPDIIGKTPLQHLCR